MDDFKPIKGYGYFFMLLMVALYNILFYLLLKVAATFELSILLKSVIVIFNLYQLYYILIYISTRYTIDNNFFTIKSIFGLKKICIPIKKIEGYLKTSGNIKGIRISGYGRDNFAIGKTMIDKIGMTYMFVTSTEKIFYIKTEDINYGISPANCEKFEAILNNLNIESIQWEYRVNKDVHLSKDKRFFIPFIIVSILVVILTLIPILLYLMNDIPAIMPLTFDANFDIKKFGSAKQFAFKQCIYGALNMALLFCMHYAAYFYAKYDKKSAYKFMYVPLISSLIFLIMQVKILITFR